MAAPNWNQAQVLAQLDSGMHWRSSTITYAFPTTSSGIYAEGEESRVPRPQLQRSRHR
jgi:hypothetical protein